VQGCSAENVVQRQLARTKFETPADSASSIAQGNAAAYTGSESWTGGWQRTGDGYAARATLMPALTLLTLPLRP